LSATARYLPLKIIFQKSKKNNISQTYLKGNKTHETLKELHPPFFDRKTQPRAYQPLRGLNP
jgi:hypothetical protein